MTLMGQGRAEEVFRGKPGCGEALPWLGSEAPSAWPHRLQGDHSLYLMCTAFPYSVSPSLGAHLCCPHLTREETEAQQGARPDLEALLAKQQS